MSRAKLSSVCGGLSIVVFLASSACVRRNEDLDRGKPVEIDLPAAKQPANFDSIRAIVDAGDKGNEHPDIKRPGTCTKGCDVPITIFSRGRTKNIKSDVALSKMQVIGEVINTDPTNTENAYKLKPNTRYLIWVAAAAQPSAKEKNEWGLFELPNQAKGTSDRKTVGMVKRCHDYINTFHKSDANFYKCTGLNSNISSHMHPATEASMWSWIPGGSRVLRWAANRAGMLRQPYALGATWFECGSGCCTGTGVVTAL
jgi:hypothetical protein